MNNVLWGRPGFEASCASCAGQCECGKDCPDAIPTAPGELEETRHEVSGLGVALVIVGCIAALVLVASWGVA